MKSFRFSGSDGILSGNTSPRRSRKAPYPETPSTRRHWRENPPDERHSGTASLAPRIYEGGGPRSGRGSPPAAAAGKASSVTASPCQLPQRGSRGRFTPFLPPAFMRGEGHAVAGGVLRRRGGDCLLSHGCAVPAPPEGKPRELRTVLAPAFMRGEGHAVAGGVPPPQRRGKPPQSRLRRASSPRGEAKRGRHRSPLPFSRGIPTAPQKTAPSKNRGGGAACQKSLAEFAARRRQRDFDHFLSGRVPDRKYNSGCKCAICTPRAHKSCARQTAILLSKKGKALF